MMRCRLNTAALGLLFATALAILAISPAWSLPNTNNGMAAPAACQRLKSDLQSARIRYVALFGLMKEAEDLGDVETFWRLNRQFYSASVHEDIQEEKFYRVCPEAPIQ
jgi:hypothetical protein